MPGDQLERIDGHWLADTFDKIQLNTPLLMAGEPVPVIVRRANGMTTDTVYIAPRMAPGSDFPRLGIGPAHTLKALDQETFDKLGRAVAAGTRN